MDPAVIVDLDGTLADVTSVRHHVVKVPGQKRDFHAFHSFASNEAPVIQNTAVLVRTFFEVGVHPVLVSGRHHRWMDATVAWLQRQCVPFSELHMRDNDDYRKDVDVKSQIYSERIEGRYQVVLAIDDRPQVIELWRMLGIPVFVVPGWMEESGG